MSCGQFLKGWEYQTTLPASCETCMQVKKQQLEQSIEQQTGSKLEKECVKVVYCHPVYLNYVEYIMWNAWLDESQTGIYIAGRNINNLRYAETSPKEPVDEGERGEWKSWLKTQHSKNENHGIWSHHVMAYRWGNTTKWKTIFLVSKSTADNDCSHEIKRHLLLGRKTMTKLDSV